MCNKKVSLFLRIYYDIYHKIKSHCDSRKLIFSKYNLPETRNTQTFTHIYIYLYSIKQNNTVHRSLASRYKLYIHLIHSHILHSYSYIHFLSVSLN